jgi:hypothetical protein
MGLFLLKSVHTGFFPLILKLYCFKVGHDFKHGALSPEMCAIYIDTTFTHVIRTDAISWWCYVFILKKLGRTVGFLNETRK